MQDHGLLLTSSIAECMGLQKDPEVYNFLPVETQIRRSLWFNICFLDSRSDYAHGPRPLIRTDEYDVKYPLNLEDTSITSQQTALKPSTGWTTKLLLIMRAEGDEKSRWLGFERMKVEKKQAKVGSVLRELEVFRRQFEAKYYPLLDERQPLQRLARLAGTIITSRLYVGLLHRYLTTPNGLTPRLRRMLIDACLVLIESGKALETETCLQPWKWYAGTWQQYHSSFLLLFDAWFYPSSAEADRIWNALDWAFDCDRSLGRAEKARGIMRSLRERSVVYKTFRKCKPPTSASREIIKTVAERLDRTDVRRSPGSPDDGVSILQASSLGGENPERMANGSIAPADTPLFEYMSNPQDPSIQSYHGSNPRLVSAYSSSGSSQVSQYETVSPVHAASYGQPRVPTRGVPQSYPPPPQPQPPLPATPSDPREQMMSMFGDMPPGGQVGHDELMNDFDWNEWDR